MSKNFRTAVSKVIIPQTIAGATGELIVLRLLEAMMAGEIIDAEDIQKVIEGA
jgi:hypothetical protein